MMKLFRAIGGRIWAFWALIAFVVTMLVFMIPFLLFCYFKKEPLKTHRFITYARVWMTIYLNTIGCPLTKKGLSNFAPGENYIVLCNHNSLMDIPISSPSIPGGNKTIAKTEMAKIPIFGMLYRTGSVLVDRSSDSSRKESYTDMKKVLQMGLHMCIYPEGTRNKTNQPLKSFHSGAFRLSIETGKAIIPGIIFNTAKVLPAGKAFFVSPRRLYIHFLPPIQAQPGENAESLKQRVFEVMEDYYVNNKPN